MSKVTWKDVKVGYDLLAKAKDDLLAKAKEVKAKDDLLAKVDVFLADLSRMCPSDEGLGGHAPIQAFIMKGYEGRKLLRTLRGDS